MEYAGDLPWGSPIYEEMKVSGRKDIIAANTIVDIMNTLNDPRRPYYFSNVNGDYIGGIYGSKNNVFNACSTFPQEIINDATYPAPLLEYTEVEFLLADAAARGGYNVTGSAESHYNAAVTESILSWGGTAAEASAYLAQASVAYSTSPGDFRKKIGFQKWISLYNQGLEGWATVRFYDTPMMNVPPVNDFTIADFPLRMPYPFDEDNVNPVNYAAAAAAIGGDESTTPLFWDVFDWAGNNH